MEQSACTGYYKALVCVAVEINSEIQVLSYGIPENDGNAHPKRYATKKSGCLTLLASENVLASR